MKQAILEYPLDRDLKGLGVFFAMLGYSARRDANVISLSVFNPLDPKTREEVPGVPLEKFFTEEKLTELQANGIKVTIH